MSRLSSAWNGVTLPAGHSQKFAGYRKAMQDALDGKSDVLIVAYPSVLGDDYEEILANLSLLAKADLGLQILMPEPRLDADHPEGKEKK